MIQDKYSREHGVVFREVFNDKQTTLKKATTVTDVEFENGVGVFNGSSSLVNYGNLPKFSFPNNIFSIRIRLKIKEAKIQNLISTQVLGAATTGFILYSNTTTIGFGIGAGTDANYATSSIVTDEFIEIIGTCDGVNNNIYINGIGGTPKAIVGNGIATRELYLGFDENASRFGNIDVDFIEIYNYALTAEEVANLYEGKTWKELPANQGQVLGSDAASGWDFTDGWTAYDGTIESSNSFQQTSSSAGVHKDILTVGKKYRVHVVGNLSNSNEFRAWDGGAFAIQETVNGDFDLTGEFTPTSTAFFLTVQNNSNTLMTITELTVKEITQESHELLLNVTGEGGVIENKVGVSLGDELHTNANAAAIGTEADATTGFTSFGLDGTGANVFESQSSIVSNGSYAIHANANDTPTGSARFYVNLDSSPFNCVVGKKYNLSFKVRHVGVGDVWRASLATATNGSDNPIITLSSTDTTFQVVSYEWVHTATHQYFSFREAAGNDGGVYFDNFSVKEIIGEIENTNVTVVKDSNRVMRFDGTAGLSVSQGLNSNRNFSFIGWIKLYDDIGVDLTVVAADESLPYNKLAIVASTTRIIAFIGDDSSFESFTVNSVLQAKLWYQLGFTIDANGNYVIYVNGVSQKTGNATKTSTVFTFNIGGQGTGYNNFLGNQDGVKVLQGVLTAQEVAQEYTATKNNYK